MPARVARADEEPRQRPLLLSTLRQHLAANAHLLGTCRHDWGFIGASLEDHAAVRSGEGRSRMLACIAREQAGIQQVRSSDADDDALLGDWASHSAVDGTNKSKIHHVVKSDQGRALRRCREQLAAATLYIEELESSMEAGRERKKEEDSRRLPGQTPPLGHANRAKGTDTASFSRVAADENSLRRQVEQRVQRLEDVNKALLYSTTWGLQRLRLIGKQMDGLHTSISHICGEHGTSAQENIPDPPRKVSPRPSALVRSEPSSFKKKTTLASSSSSESSMEDSEEDAFWSKHSGFGSGHRRACWAKPRSRDQDSSDKSSSSSSSSSWAELKQSDSDCLSTAQLPPSFTKAQPPKKEQRRGRQTSWAEDESEQVECRWGQRSGGDRTSAEAHGGAATGPAHELEVLMRLAAKRRLA